MALTLRLGLSHYGHLRKTINYTLLCRSLGNETSQRVETLAPSKPPNLHNYNINEPKEFTKSVNNVQCFANDKLKETVNQEFEKARAKVITLPNIITFTRMATAPAIGYFIFNGMHSYALACFAFAAVTDALDGFIARRFNQVSDIGIIIDPIADKLLLTTCFIAMYNIDMIPLWAMKGFVARDLIILIGGSAMRYFGLREKVSLKTFLDFKNYPTIGFEPTLTSKCNTALQCLLIVVHLSTNHLVGIPSYDWSIFGLQLITMSTTVFSLTQYIVRSMATDGLTTRKSIRTRG